MNTLIRMGVLLWALVFFTTCKTEKTFDDMLQESFVTVEGGRIWYKIYGQNASGTPLLVVHGGPGAAHNYLLSLEALADERPVIFYDQLGCGQSDKPQDTALWQTDRFVRELHSLVSALRLEKFHLLGQSWGGFLAGSYLNQYGDDRVLSLTLSAPLISTSDWIADQQYWIDQLPGGLNDSIRKYESLGDYAAPAYQEAMGVFYSRHLCRLDPWPELVTKTFEQMNAGQYNYMWGPSEFTATGNLKDADLKAFLPDVKLPCLITCGEYDEARPERMQQYQAMMPNCRLEVFEGASHMHHLEAEEAFNQRLSEFLRQYN
jgi:proline iminopeptidase